MNDDDARDEPRDEMSEMPETDEPGEVNEVGEMGEMGGTASTADDERRGRRLRELLDGDATSDPSNPPVDPMAGAVSWPRLQHQAAQRRTRKVAGLGLAAALVLLVGATAVALGHHGGANDIAVQDFEVAQRSGAGALGSSSMGSSPADAVRGPSCLAVPGPGPGTSMICEVTSGVPDGMVPVVPPSTDSGSVQTMPGRCTESVSPPSHCPATTTTASGAAPQTTIPHTTGSTYDTTPPTATPLGGNCGSWGPTGWPTTIPAPSTLAQCLISAFDAGVPATFQVRNYVYDPEHPVTTTYVVTGGHVVRVTVDSTHSSVPPQAVTVRDCTQMTDDWPNSDVVSVDQCSTVSG